MSTTHQIRDNRRQQWGWFNYEVLDQFAPTIGPSGIAVYMALIRFADNETQTCYPSLETIGARSGLTERQVRRVLPVLIAAGLISSTPQYDGDGRQKSNLYTLLNVPDLVDRGDILSPSPRTICPPPPDNMSPKQDPGNKTHPNKRETAPAQGPIVVTLYQPEATGDISLIAPVACESPGEPEVTISVPRGTPVNRRPDAPPRQPRPQPKPETTTARLKTWEPDADTRAAFEAECHARHIDPACIDVRAETVKWRLRKETAGLLPGQWSADWQFWLIRAMERYQAKQREGPQTVSGRPYKVL